jgi:RND family efflux transporter MFP subunit
MKQSKLLRLAKRHAYVTTAVFVVVIVAIGGLGYHFIEASNAAPASTAKKSGRASTVVSVASVSSLSPNGAPLSLIGEVSSENQATVLAQVAGEIVTVERKLGDQVTAGERIAVMENSSQQAAVVQAEGSYDAAEAVVEEAKGTTAENSSVTSSQASQNEQNTETSANAALQSAYTSLDDAIHTKADTLFTDPRTQFSSLDAPITYQGDTNLYTTIVTERRSLESVLDNAYSISTDTSAADIDTNISVMVKNVQTVETFLDNLTQAVNELVPDSSTATEISGYQSTVAAARTEVTATVPILTTAKTNYDSSTASAATAANTATGGTTESIDVAEANLQEETGALDAAKSALEKTIITSPISGTIIDLPVTSGDYVPSFSEVAKVSNPTALKVTTYVSATDAATLSSGNAVMINGTVPGVITQIAPAIDPETGTIEVDIGLTGSQTGVIDGDSVTVTLNRTTSAVVSTTSSIIIPIVALKITPTGPAVFTVDPTKHMLVSHSVQIGSILGDNIVITSGLTSDMQIVSDARGLVVGQSVTVHK